MVDPDKSGSHCNHTASYANIHTKTEGLRTMVARLRFHNIAMCYSKTVLGAFHTSLASLSLTSLKSQLTRVQSLYIVLVN